jgi:signal transduction histidine kinase
MASIMMFAVLSLMGFLNRPRDSASVAFATFAGVLAIDTFTTTLMLQTTTEETFRTSMHVAFTVGILVPASALFHVLACTGFISRMQERVLGIRVRPLVILMLALLALIGALFHVVFLEGIERLPSGRFSARLTPLAVVFALVAVVLIAALIMVFMVKALREASPGLRRSYLRTNLIGMLLIMVPGPMIGIISTLVQFEAQLLMQVPVIAGAFLFYLAINRYQLGRIQELNVGLEAKVAQRTRHLEEAQLQLVQGEKAAALGSLVAGVTHEVSTPTGAIVSSADTIERAVGRIRAGVAELEEAAARKVTRAIDAVAESNAVVTSSGQRIAHLVENLKGFVHLDGAEQHEVDLRRALDGTIDLLRHELPPGIEVIREYGEIPTVWGSQADLNQVFMHLLRNAGQAISDEGVITIRTAARGDGVSVSFTDDGRGIAADRIDRLFELQFSSGESRVKLGVGLATCRQIVQRHGGEISVESAPGQGATFTLSLPLGTR